MLKTITWQEVAMMAVLASATIAAYKLLGPEAGAAMGTITALAAFLSGRKTHP